MTAQEAKRQYEFEENLTFDQPVIVRWIRHRRCYEAIATVERVTVKTIIVTLKTAPHPYTLGRRIVVPRLMAIGRWSRHNGCFPLD